MQQSPNPMQIMGMPMGMNMMQGNNMMPMMEMQPNNMGGYGTTEEMQMQMRPTTEVIEQIQEIIEQAIPHYLSFVRRWCIAYNHYIA